MIPDRFRNEVCGGACGSCAQIISQIERQRAGILSWSNDIDDSSQQMSARLSDCENRILAVECGGGGKRPPEGEIRSP